MKRLFYIPLWSIALVGSAFAQQQPADPAFLSRAIPVLQAQRNQAMDLAAAQQARADGLAEELGKAKAHIKEIEKPAEQPKE